MQCPPYGGGSCGSTVTTTVTHFAHHVVAHTPSGLPFTGGDVVGLSLIGIGALAGGIALLRGGRRKAAV